MARAAAARLVGLDIGSSGLRAVEVRRRAGGLPEIVRAAAVDLPTGIIGNGTITDEHALVSALKRLWKTGRFGTRTVAIALSEATLLTRQMDLPWMPDDDFRSALRYQVQDSLPVDTATVELDAHTLSETHALDRSGHPVETKRVLVVAADRATTIAMAQTVRKARLSPMIIDSSAFALIRAVCHGRLPDDDVPRVIVDIGAEATTVVVHAAGQPRFIRTITNTGGDHATNAIADALDLDFAEAEAMKRQVGLNGPAPVVATVSESSVFSSLAEVQPMLDPRTQAAVDALNPWATAVVGEIRNSIDYFLSSAAPDTQIASITLCGRASLLDGLLERIATQVPVAVHRLDRFVGLPVSRRVLRNPPSDARYAIAIGLALGVLP